VVIVVKHFNVSNTNKKLKGGFILNSKKILSMILVLVLLLGTFTTVMAAPDRNIKALSKKSVNRESIGNSIAVDPRAKELKDSDQVRIIVELTDKPLIEYATVKGVKVNELSTLTVEKVTDELTTVQATVKNNIKANNINVKYHNNFINVINGFSGTTTLAEAKKIEKLQGVKSVYLANEYSRPAPNMVNSKELIKARETWAQLGYKGEGMVAAIIDTGVDPSHKDMVLTDASEAN